MAAVTLAELNACDARTFVDVCGPCYEHAPWVAARVVGLRPFVSREAVHAACERAVAEATVAEQLALIRGHPDLVGRAARHPDGGLARTGRLTPASAGEQAAAGLFALDATEIEAFTRYNAAYREKFGFPFVICARDNKKEAILAAFPRRLGQTADEERATALREIGRIAWLRLCDAVRET
jgi:2-oxo-4-hydroxy-4-carboxy-5-ureidoimidazoline decarboxylase